MNLLLNILLIASCFLLAALALRTGASLKLTGIPALFAIIMFYWVWVIGDLIEVNSPDFQWMLAGRNIQQLGVFFTPLCTLYFSIAYTSNARLKPFACFFTVVEILSVLLIFTDPLHHLMRASVAVASDAVFGRSVTVESTKLGSALVALNFCIPLLSVANLILFTRRVSVKLKRPLWLIIVSMLATFLLALLQSSVLSPCGVNIPIPVLNLPCLALFAYAVLRGGFIGVTPTAFNKVFEVIDQGIIIVDRAGAVLEFNRRAAELMEDIAAPSRIETGSDFMALIRQRREIPASVFSADSLPAELQDAQRNRTVALACHALTSPKGKLAGYVIVLTDITLLKVRAEIDSLTGSYNREGLSNAFSGLQKVSMGIPSISAMIIDLDDFKHINDTYGHLGGDVILRDFVRIAQSLLSEKHFLGRLGGDEFVAVLPAGLDEATRLAEQLRLRVAERTVPYLNHSIRYTISVGIASCRFEECSLSDLLHLADEALYKAKHQGKNMIFAQPDPA